MPPSRRPRSPPRPAAPPPWEPPPEVPLAAPPPRPPGGALRLRRRSGPWPAGGAALSRAGRIPLARRERRTRMLEMRTEPGGTPQLLWRQSLPKPGTPRHCRRASARVSFKALQRRWRRESGKPVEPRMVFAVGKSLLISRLDFPPVEPLHPVLPFGELRRNPLRPAGALQVREGAPGSLRRPLHGLASGPLAPSVASSALFLRASFSRWGHRHRTRPSKRDLTQQHREAPSTPANISMLSLRPRSSGRRWLLGSSAHLPAPP